MSRLDDFPEALVKWIFRMKIYLGQFAVPHHHRQSVVEVMRDSARQAPNGLHFERLSKLLLEQFAAGNVVQRAFNKQNFTGIGAHLARTLENPEFSRIRPANFVLKIAHDSSAVQQ